MFHAIQLTVDTKFSSNGRPKDRTGVVAVPYPDVAIDVVGVNGRYQEMWLFRG